MFALRALLATCALAAPLFLYYNAFIKNLFTGRRGSFMGSLKTASSDKVCPGSGAFLHHAKCQATFSVDRKCADVVKEIHNRINGLNGWVDMHNGGHYTYEGEVKPNSYGGIEVQRKTGNGKFTDKMVIGFESTKTGQSCDVRGCSESQITSYMDYSTNYCNVRTLICGSAEGCPVADKTNGDFVVMKETLQDCDYHDKAQCQGKHAEYEGKAVNVAASEQEVQYI